MVFILVSASVHAALVITSSRSTNITLPSSTGSAMSVKMQEKHKPLTQTVMSKPISKKIINDTIRKEISQLKTNNKPVSEKPVEEAQKQTNDKITIAAEKIQPAESKARVISIIYKELNQHFIYPKLAQKHNWQGKVLLSLRVSSNGKINNVEIYKSSGYSILDQAAINSLMKVEYLPRISSWLPHDLNLKLPVIYKLTKG